MLGAEAPFPAQPGDRPEKVVGIARPGRGAGNGFEPRAFVAGLLAANEPELGFFRIEERNRRDVVKGSGRAAGARHGQTPWGTVDCSYFRNKRRTITLYICSKSHVNT